MTAMVGLDKPLASWKCPQTPDKVSYASFEAARESGDKREPIERAKLYVYACSACGRWHLSKKRGDEYVAGVGPGGLIKTVGDISTPAIQRDVRFLLESPTSKAVGQLNRLFRENPGIEHIRASEIATKIGDDAPARWILTDALKALGWTMTGVKRSAIWHKPGSVIPETNVVSIAPKVQQSETAKSLERMTKTINEAAKGLTPKRTPAKKPPVQNMDTRWETVQLNDELKSLTVGQMLALYASVGINMEVRIRR